MRASWDWAFCREVENVHFPPSPFYGPGCSGGHRSSGAWRRRNPMEGSVLGWMRARLVRERHYSSLQTNGASTGWIARSARVVQLLLGPACLYLSFEETAVLAGANRKHTGGPERNLLEATKKHAQKKPEPKRFETLFGQAAEPLSESKWKAFLECCWTKQARENPFPSQRPRNHQTMSKRSPPINTSKRNLNQCVLKPSQFLMGKSTINGHFQ